MEQISKLNYNHHLRADQKADQFNITVQTIKFNLSSHNSSKSIIKSDATYTYLLTGFGGLIGDTCIL